MDTKNVNIVFFDGICSFCNGFIRFLIQKDKLETLRYAPLQSEYAINYLKKINVEFDLSTIIFVKDEKVYKRSDALIQIFKSLSLGLKILGFFLSFSPRFVRNFFYQQFAKNRYTLFGKKDKCKVPNKNISHLFLVKNK